MWKAARGCYEAQRGTSEERYFAVSVVLLRGPLAVCRPARAAERLTSPQDADAPALRRPRDTLGYFLSFWDAVGAGRILTVGRGDATLT